MLYLINIYHAMAERDAAPDTPSPNLVINNERSPYCHNFYCLLFVPIYIQYFLFSIRADLSRSADDDYISNLKD